jgi:hypothetical protein
MSSKPETIRHREHTMSVPHYAIAYLRDVQVGEEILPLRTEHSNSMAALVAGVPANYQATDKIAQLLGEAS